MSPFFICKNINGGMGGKGEIGKVEIKIPVAPLSIDILCFLTVHNRVFILVMTLNSEEYGD